ncbi:MAG: XdhC/CoxI family protein [Syntrophales bacterium]|jgi:xanthine dehydrogenase accessory factor|nr:XdhC/CoxI family protein [Syntrophales bacterium]NLN59496.1 xanthine dehydrogenase [Deltaproteobacteria bacterium]
MGDIYEEILKVKNRGECAALATVISVDGSTPREQGAKMLIRQDGTIEGTIGGGLMEKMAREEAEKVIENGIPKMVHFDLTGREKDAMICGGVATVFIEAIVPKASVYIMGAGHIGYHLARMAKMVDFRVVVCDNRPEYANRERFPEVDDLHTDDYEQIFPKLPVSASSYIVIVTHGHAHDQMALEWALETQARYIGMIGSRKKTRQVLDNLIEKGVSAEDIEKRVHSPIGLNINAETPAEIAVSIIAEMIQVSYSDGPPVKHTCCSG